MLGDAAGLAVEDLVVVPEHLHAGEPPAVVTQPSRQHAHQGALARARVPENTDPAEVAAVPTSGGGGGSKSQKTCGDRYKKAKGGGGRSSAELKWGGGGILTRNSRIETTTYFRIILEIKATIVHR